MDTDRESYSLLVCNGPCICCHAIKVTAPAPLSSLLASVYMPPNHKEWIMALKKPSTGVGKSLADMPLWEDPNFLDEYPHLHAFLRDTRYDDGSARLPGTMSLFVKNDVLSVALNDNDNKRTAFINARTFAELMFMANEAICAEGTDWKVRLQPASDKKIPF